MKAPSTLPHITNTEISKKLTKSYRYLLVYNSSNGTSS